MPTIEWNVDAWDRTHGWKDKEEEWSSSYPGGSKTIWYASILPRIHHFVPADTILEIAPGMGRWTQYLKNLCNRLVVVDISQKCIKYCQTRFADSPNISYHVNDGKSLDMIDDSSVDFVFSYDSLVHVEGDVLEAYIAQLATKLRPNGVGFIHHSNIGDYSWQLRLPYKLRSLLGYSKLNARADTTAQLFANLCNEAGLHCASQELVNWDTHRYFLTDAFSIFSHADIPNTVIKNRNFMKGCFEVIKLAGATRRALKK
jgi:2-polyprenyl-3-methyl-5-hydroxy-6-metoxy-1,4-benzoquinol methylase